ncbi:MAG: amidohydrolase family protein [Chitinivibrionales bacterium]|nr:amidohydrolase family protein [Chitinivibrionales bacterium]
MIDFPIVDGHLHVWDVDRWYYPWLDDVPVLKKTYLLKDYHEATGPVQVEKMVFVQCEIEPSRYMEEVEWITGLATGEDKRIKGIVSWCPLEKGDGARAELEKLAANPLVKGIRRIIQFEPDMEFCLKPDFIAGVNMLPDYGMTFDICIDYRHTKVAAQFVDKCSDVPMVLDHIGKPGIAKGLLDPWRNEIKELAKRPNVMCKVSSLATEADHEHWTVDDIRPYADTIFDAFGIERCFFAGDWPVSGMAATFPQCVETVEELVKGASQDECKALFHDNCEQFYKV